MSRSKIDTIDEIFNKCNEYLIGDIGTITETKLFIGEKLQEAWEEGYNQRAQVKTVFYGV